ncbi:MAG: ADP-ribosylglycohydrolase family protein [Chloroflexi bacterium]|nr:ADP-ribosylglycohydrolase family protein [Chloroflexota bacterium]
MPLLQDYTERVYAGVLGKLIGVYLGRPFEGWSYEQITQRLGEITYYVHEKLNVPLIVTDDDISGTFTFLRALPDYGNTLELTPAQIGQTWLNYLIEKRTILWWGGLGNSTEHTAYLRLKHGVQAPQSGSIALNGQVVAEQIGAQIFIDGWAMVAPGDPELAADLARRAASVSHDGEAIYGAQVWAAMEALAFVEPDVNRLIDVAVALIPRDSVIARMIADIREWRVGEPDWRRGRELLASHYGYDKYGGNCHMAPNHGLMILSLLYGDDDFQRTLMIVNTSGWDTDCNSGNVGCLMGIKNGLEGLETGPDWRGPVADRLYIPTADGGRAITDAVTEAYHIVNVGRALAGEGPEAPKNGARYHFELPGAVQGFMPEGSIESEGTLYLENTVGHSQEGERSLAFHYHRLAPGRVARAATSTFIPSLDVATYFETRGYALLASPSLYPGQTIQAALEADAANIRVVTSRLYVSVYGDDDQLIKLYSPAIDLAPGDSQEFAWRVPETHSAPIAAAGVELSSDTRADGTVYLDYLTWKGAPDMVSTQREGNNTMWRRAWVSALDHPVAARYPEPFRVIQNEGVGLVVLGTREWMDYQLRADVTPHLVESCGIAARVQGLQRYYALLLCRDQRVRLVKALDGITVLAEGELAWEFGTTFDLTLRVVGNTIRGEVDGRVVLEYTDTERPLTSGAIALVCEEGRTATQAVTVQPVSPRDPA